MAGPLQFQCSGGVKRGAQPDQGSGKNEGGNKVDVFAGNPHDRPGANAKETP